MKSALIPSCPIIISDYIFFPTNNTFAVFIFHFVGFPSIFGWLDAWIRIKRLLSRLGKNESRLRRRSTSPLEKKKTKTKPLFGLLIFRFHFIVAVIRISFRSVEIDTWALIFFINSFRYVVFSYLLHQDAVHRHPPLRRPNDSRRKCGICNYCNFDNSKQAPHCISFACIFLLSAGIGAPHFIFAFFPFDSTSK